MQSIVQIETNRQGLSHAPRTSRIASWPAHWWLCYHSPLPTPRVSQLACPLLTWLPFSSSYSQSQSVGLPIADFLTTPLFLLPESVSWPAHCWLCYLSPHPTPRVSQLACPLLTFLPLPSSYSQSQSVGLPIADFVTTLLILLPESDSWPARCWLCYHFPLPTHRVSQLTCPLLTLLPLSSSYSQSQPVDLPVADFITTLFILISESANWLAHCWLCYYSPLPTPRVSQSTCPLLILLPLSSFYSQSASWPAHCWLHYHSPHPTPRVIAPPPPPPPLLIVLTLPSSLNSWPGEPMSTWRHKSLLSYL